MTVCNNFHYRRFGARILKTRAPFHVTDSGLLIQKKKKKKIALTSPFFLGKEVLSFLGYWPSAKSIHIL